MQLAYAECVRQLREHLAVKYVQVVSDVKCDDLNGEEKMHQHEMPNTENDDGVMALLPSIVACSLPCLEVLIELWESGPTPLQRAPGGRLLVNGGQAAASMAWKLEGSYP